MYWSTDLGGKYHVPCLAAENQVMIIPLYADEE